MPNSLNKCFYELFRSKEHAVFIDELWVNRRSLKYRNLLRQNASAENYFELESNDLTKEGIVSALAQSKTVIDDLSGYRRATAFLEKNTPGILIFHQTHLMSTNVVHLVSRVVRHAKRRDLDWKFIFLGNQRKTSTLTLDQLFIDKYFPIKSEPKPVPEAKAEKVAEAKQKKTLSLVLPLICLAVAAILLFDNRQEQDNSISADNQNEIVTIGSSRIEPSVTEVDDHARNVALLEAIRQSRLRELEFEQMLAKIDSRANDQVENENPAREAPVFEPKIVSSTIKQNTISSPVKPPTPERTSVVDIPAEAETAIRNNDLVTVQNLLNSDALRVSENKVGESPLVIAATTGNQQVVDWLLSKKVPVNAPDQYGRTAIFYAAINGDLGVTESIINAGGRVNIRSKLSKTPLMAAVNNDHFATAKLLIDRGSNVKTVDHSGWPAIFYAAWNVNLEMVNLLIDNGADTNVKDNSGVTLREIAIAKDSKQIIDLLE